MKRVFVSYSRKNLDIVAQLVQDLQAVGVEVWHDQTLTGGQRWWDNILANIRECDIFVLALSPDSWESEACKSELGYVIPLGKTVLPVLVADGINLNLLPSPLNEIQITDYRRRDKEASFALIRSINTALPTPPLPDPLPAPPRVPVSYLSNLKERIDSSDTLSSQDQVTLLFELEGGLREGRSPTEIRELLLRLGRRPDLLAKVAVKIEAALRSLEEGVAAQPREDAGHGPTTSVHSHGDLGSDHRRFDGPKLCPQCGMRVDRESRYCTACGASLTGLSGPTSVPEPPGPKASRSKSRRYACPSSDSARLIGEVKSWLDAQGFDSQQMSTENKSVLLQIKKRGKWRDFVGMSTSLNIVFHQLDDTLTVEIGAGKWIDKAAVGTVSMFILWPLALTAGFGAWEQIKMPEKIFDYIAARLVYK
ncbi:MAG: TIR domain-containing protein [Bryobacteraceae bacterium]|jgi:hypothetical protein